MDIKNILNLLCIGAIMISVSSCRIHHPRYFNSPSAHAPAFLKEKGDKMVSANIAILPKDEYGENTPYKLRTRPFQISAGFSIYP